MNTVEVKGIKKIFVFFINVYGLVTFLSISSILLVMIFDYEYVDSHVEAESQQGEQPSEYWTKERMEEAEPQPMPTVSKTDELKKFVTDTLPVLVILFIIFTAVFILMIMRKITLLEKQNKDIVNALSNIADRPHD